MNTPIVFGSTDLCAARHALPRRVAISLVVSLRFGRRSLRDEGSRQRSTHPTLMPGPRRSVLVRIVGNTGLTFCSAAGALTAPDDSCLATGIRSVRR